MSSPNIKAFVLAAGYGSRLGDIGLQTPKCLVQAGGTTLLELVLAGIYRAGITEVVVNAFHLAEAVGQYIQSLQEQGQKIEVSFEPELLGTGGGLFFAREKFQNCNYVLIHNSDIIHDFALGQLIEYAMTARADAVLLCAQRTTDRVFLFSEDGTLVGHADKTQNIQRFVRPDDTCSKEYGFSGVSIIRRELLDNVIMDSHNFSLVSFFLRAAENGFDIKCLDQGDTYWLDAGTPERLEQLNRDLKSGRLRS
jgi:NDP-sugar pyrophosphorylase family protein